MKLNLGEKRTELLYDQVNFDIAKCLTFVTGQGTARSQAELETRIIISHICHFMFVQDQPVIPLAPLSFSVLPNQSNGKDCTYDSTKDNHCKSDPITSKIPRRFGPYEDIACDNPANVAKRDLDR